MDKRKGERRSRYLRPRFSRERRLASVAEGGAVTVTDRAVVG